MKRLILICLLALVSGTAQGQSVIKIDTALPDLVIDTSLSDTTFDTLWAGRTFHTPLTDLYLQSGDLLASEIARGASRYKQHSYYLQFNWCGVQ